MTDEVPPTYIFSAIIPPNRVTMQISNVALGIVFYIVVPVEIGIHKPVPKQLLMRHDQEVSSVQGIVHSLHPFSHRNQQLHL